MTPTSVYNGKSASVTAIHVDMRRRHAGLVRAITVAAMAAAAMLVTLTGSRAQELPEKSNDAAQVSRAVSADTVAAKDTATAQSTAAQEISRADLARLLKDRPRDFTLIDVRTAEEFAQGHVPSAINIPLDQLAARTSELGADDEIIVYCFSGGRAQQAIELLRQREFTHVTHLSGDYPAWQHSPRSLSD